MKVVHHLEFSWK